MEEEPSSLQTNESQPPNGYPRSGFILLAIALVFLIIFISIVQHVAAPKRQEEPSISEAAIEGDISIKLYYAYGRWMSRLPAETADRQGTEAFRETQRRSAITWYERAAEQNPSAYNLRRLLIIQYPGKREQVIDRLAEIEFPRSSEVPGVPSEVDMWGDIYTGDERISPTDVAAYSSAIRGTHLGWYQHPALAQLYARGRMDAEAKQELLIAETQASRTIILLGILVFGLAILGLTGLGLMIWFISKKGSGWSYAPSAVSEMTPEARSRLSGILLESFVVYLAIAISIQVMAAIAIIGGFPASRYDNANLMVVITAGVYVLSGVFALAYLAHRMRSHGITWKMIGLASDHPFRDVLWGVGGYAAALPLLLIAGVASQFVGRYVPTPPNPVVPLFAETQTLAGKLILFALVTVAAPFFEEIFFRGVLVNSFRARWSIKAGIVLSALVFSLVHPLPLGLLPIFVLGTIFAILLAQRGSLLPSMISHGLNNGVAFTLLFILTGS